MRDKGGQYMLTKHNMAKDMTIINIYVPNNVSSKYMKQKLTELKGETLLQ